MKNEKQRKMCYAILTKNLKMCQNEMIINPLLREIKTRGDKNYLNV